ncbi:hypothetical protein [Nocardioides marinquilinus]|uniref:hypothetical protein n=1 Tax=Nocardioides marinquilinus TaxID=1210400 RepID=UPI0031E7021D
MRGALARNLGLDPGADDPVDAALVEHHLEAISTLMIERGESPFVRQVGTTIADVAREHTPFTGSCKAGTHVDDSRPCDEFERALCLALSWLRSSVVFTPPGPQTRWPESPLHRAVLLRLVAERSLDRVDPTGWLAAQLRDFADLLIVAETHEWFGTKEDAGQ